MEKSLTEFQKIVNNQFFETVLIRKKQPFYYFIGTHPHLYDGLDIDGLSINLINVYFYEWLVNPLHFEHRFTTILQRELARYNNTRNIELSHQIMELFTNKSNKSIINDAIRDMRSMRAGINKENSEQNAEFNAINTSQETSESAGTSTNKTNSETDGTSKNANKDLPMQANGDDFETIVDWSEGASGVNQNTSNTTASENTTQNDSNNTSRNIAGTNENTSNITNEIKKEDAQKIADLEKRLNSGLESYKEIKGQAVFLINNICKYLYQPRAIDFLIERLKTAFYKIY